MHLISAICSGISGAANGTAEIYRRGTSTRATIFLDFEGTSAVSTGADITLDENGASTVYVNELVEVLVKTSDGTTVRDFVAGCASGAVEYQGQGFTGTDYTSAATGAGKPTTLQAILDLWKDSAGATDWDVSIGGVSTSMADAFAGSLSIVFNVLNSAYGATGDGTTDDTTAIGEAITAAAVSGGVVYFPPGTYRTTSELTLPDKVSALGAGAGSTSILIDHASRNVFKVSSTTTNENQFIAGLTIAASQSNSGNHISVTGSKSLIVRECYLGSSTNTTGTCITLSASATARVVIERCGFVFAGSTAKGVSIAGSLLRATVADCVFTTPATYSGTVVSGDHVDVARCYFDGSAATSGTFSYYAAVSTTLDATINDCKFLNGGGATVTAMTLGSYASGSAFAEDNNQFGSTVTAYSYASSGSTTAIVALNTRESRYYTASSSGTGAVNAPTDQYGTVQIARTNNSAFTLNVAVPPQGSRGRIEVYANGATTGNITFSGLNTPTNPATVTNAHYKSWDYYVGQIGGFRNCISLNDGQDHS